jgi:uncharacterized DUF497 family protein
LNGPQFEWDAAKAEANLRKHGVSFEAATTVFNDPNRVIEPDAEHSEDEDRFRIIGLSDRLRLLLVIFTERHETTFRIITARRATKAETRRYSTQA